MQTSHTLLLTNHFFTQYCSAMTRNVWMYCSFFKLFFLENTRHLILIYFYSQLMVPGQLGDHGDLVPLPVKLEPNYVIEHVQTQHLNMVVSPVVVWTTTHKPVPCQCVQVSIQLFICQCYNYFRLRFTASGDFFRIFIPPFFQT